MSTQYTRWPSTGGVPTYANAAALPATATSGSLAVTLDTDTLWVFSGSTWLVVGGSGVPLSVGTIDSQTASSNGAVLASNQLVMQSASSTRPGLVNNTTQTLSGAKTFSSDLTAQTSLITTSIKTLGGASSSDLNITTGDASAGDSGNINLNPGTATGTAGLVKTNSQIKIGSGSLPNPFTSSTLISDIQINPSDSKDHEISILTDQAGLSAYVSGSAGSNNSSVYLGSVIAGNTFYLMGDDGRNQFSILPSGEIQLGHIDSSSNRPTSGSFVYISGDTSGGAALFKVDELNNALGTVFSIEANGIINANTNHISNLATPSDPTDAANKTYVDTNFPNVTLGTANGLSLTGQILSLGLASTSTTGSLSSTDWNTFNGKQSSISLAAFGSTPNANGLTFSSNTLNMQPANGTNPGGVSITTQTFAGAKTFSSTPTFSTMTSGSLLFAGASGVLSQDNSNLFYDSTNKRVGIATASPGTALHISGPASPLGGITLPNNSVLQFGTAPGGAGDFADYALLGNFQTYTILNCGTGGQLYFRIGNITKGAMDPSGNWSANTYTSSATTNQLVLGTTKTVTINSTAPAASRVYTIADAGGNDTFTMNAASQTLTTKTIDTASNTIKATGATANYVLTADGSNNTSWQPVTGVLSYSTATSSIKTPSNSGDWLQFTGNSIALGSGTWMLTGTVVFDNNGSAPAYTEVDVKWGSANGADSGSEPTTLTVLSGFAGKCRFNYGSTGANASSWWVTPQTVICNGSQTVYLDASVILSTPSNSRVTAYINAVKIA